jgi:hypothetical protein
MVLFLFSKEEVELCKRRDLLEEMLALMSEEFPALGTVFVNERDVFLTHSLQTAAQPQLTPTGWVYSCCVFIFQSNQHISCRQTHN